MKTRRDREVAADRSALHCQNTTWQTTPRRPSELKQTPRKAGGDQSDVGGAMRPHPVGPLILSADPQTRSRRPTSNRAAVKTAPDRRVPREGDSHNTRAHLSGFG